jgi:hypothetical protein
MRVRPQIALLTALLGTTAAAGIPTTATARTVAWTPAPADRLQYQLQPGTDGTGGIRVGICATPYTGGACVKPTVYDIDLYGPDGTTPNTAAVNAIHAAGAHAVCYVDAGTWEDWRPDQAGFPEADKGAEVEGGPDGEPWPGERWLDIRDTTRLLPLIDARVAKCEHAGYDSVEFDNVDGYDNDTGFPLTAANQLAYNRGLAKVAHDRGLSAGLKNDLGQVRDLVGTFDYAVNEQCQQYGECGGLTPFLTAGKAVFQIEYRDDGAKTATFCPPANKAGRSAILKTFDLTATPWTPCR